MPTGTTAKAQRLRAEEAAREAERAERQAAAEAARYAEHADAAEQRRRAAMEQEYTQLRAELKALGKQCKGGKLTPSEVRRLGMRAKVERYNHLKLELGGGSD